MSNGGSFGKIVIRFVATIASGILVGHEQMLANWNAEGSENLMQGKHVNPLTDHEHCEIKHMS